MKTIQLSLSTLILSVLTACGGGGTDSVDTSPQGSISGTVTKGPVSNAAVTAYGIGNGQMGSQIGTATTDANGNFTMTVAGHTGPVMLQVSGGRYIDEATGASMAMGAGDVMTAVMPNIDAGASYGGIQVTPVTAMAQAMANRMAGGMTDANIVAANAAMGRYFAVADILHTQPMNPLVTGSGATASQDARNYGMTLAAMSKYAQSQGMSSSSAMMTAADERCGRRSHGRQKWWRPDFDVDGRNDGRRHDVADSRNQRFGWSDDGLHEFKHERIGHDACGNGVAHPDAHHFQRTTVMLALSDHTMRRAAATTNVSRR